MLQWLILQKTETYLFNYIIEYHGNKHHLQALLQFLTQMGVRGGGYVPVFLMRNALWHSIFYYFSSCKGMLSFVYDVSSRWEEQHDTRNKWEIKALYFMWNSQRGKKLHRFLSSSLFTLNENKYFQSFNHKFESVSLILQLRTIQLREATLWPEVLFSIWGKLPERFAKRNIHLKGSYC